jgi:RecA-family ATPase
METDFKLQTLDEILLQMEVDGFTGFLVDGVIDTSVSTILGDSFLGKTYMALDLARSLTTGEPFLGRRVNREARRVAFLGTDPGSKFTIAKRGSAAGLDLTRVFGTSFYAPKDWDEWKEGLRTLQANDVDVAVIDNTTDLADDANGPREVKLITDGLRLWSESGVSIVNIHHQNKGGPWGRSGFGSILWRKWTRSELTLTGNPAKPDRTLKAIPNDAPATEWALTFNPESSPAFTVKGEAQTLQRERQRDKETTDRRRAIARWIVANHQRTSNVSEVSRKVAERFSGKADSHRTCINKSIYPVRWDDNAGWTLVGGE